MRSALVIIVFILSVVCCGCSRIDSNRIPYAPVNIQLNNDGLWNTYGVSAPGMGRRFIKPDVPSRAFFNAMSYTGFGGVLLYCNGQGVPVAYDLSCPVEAKQSVRVFVNEAMEAECPVCGSRYSILLGAGGPISGPAVEYKYGLQRYSVVPQSMGGYNICR
ncbi:MAG: hypothetical protein K2J74_01395 [Muribaculaceae bacterium]|nr:hypothetical protein [Muribaculaceae bacterium]